MKKNNRNETIIAVTMMTATTNKKRSLKSRERDACILINIVLLSIFAKKYLL